MTQFETLRATAMEHGMTLTRMGGHAFLLYGALGKWQLFGLYAVAKRLESFRA